MDICEKLPKEFWSSQEFAFYCHDILASIIVEGEKNKIFDENITVNKSEKQELETCRDKHIIDWLEDKERYSDIKKIYTKQLFKCLLGDMCHYIYESLKCSEKGKLTVAYDLMRKPFKDNLFYLEWLLGNTDEFLDLYMNDEPIKYAVDKLHIKKKINIFNTAKSKTYGESAFDSNFLYKVRFDKKVIYGLERMWNKATHLITTNPHYKTEKENINFVFSTYEDMYDQWKFYYTVVPYMLFYVVEIVEAILLKIIKIDSEKLEMNRMLRFAKFFKWSNKDGKLNNKKIFEIINGRQLKFLCADCGNIINFNVFHVGQLGEHGCIICNNCKYENNIATYYL